MVAINSRAQENSLKGDHSFKILAGMTGIGLSYEINPVKNSFFEIGASSSYGLSRYGLQLKYALINKESFKLKLGLDGSGFATIPGGYLLVKQSFPKYTVMPHLSVENSEIGLQCSILVYDDAGKRKYFPVLGLTLNVTHSRRNDREGK